MAEMNVVGITSHCKDASPVELRSAIQILTRSQVCLLWYIEGHQGFRNSIDGVLLIAAARFTAWE